MWRKNNIEWWRKNNLLFKRISYMKEGSFTAVPLSFSNCPYSSCLPSYSLSTITTIPPLRWELPILYSFPCPVLLHYLLLQTLSITNRPKLSGKAGQLLPSAWVRQWLKLESSFVFSVIYLDKMVRIAGVLLAFLFMVVFEWLDFLHDFLHSKHMFERLRQRCKASLNPAL